MRALTIALAMGLSGLVTTSACSLAHIGDPNHNDKIRYSMAHGHAAQVLDEQGVELDLHRDYESMTFWRRDYDEENHVLHDYQLYDFLKTSDRLGPERLLIAYDTATRQTYRRSNLRSNENLDAGRPDREPGKDKHH